MKYQKFLSQVQNIFWLRQIKIIRTNYTVNTNFHKGELYNDDKKVLWYVAKECYREIEEYRYIIGNGEKIDFQEKMRECFIACEENEEINDKIRQALFLLGTTDYLFTKKNVSIC